MNSFIESRTMTVTMHRCEIKVICPNFLIELLVLYEGEASQDGGRKMFILIAVKGTYQ
jgi:hypothetical protein